MDIYRIFTPEELLKDNTYPGRGIIIGKTPDGTKAMTAYFIMGRSDNSRNRIFTEKNGEVFTEPFDASKVQDPSLIIYAAIRSYDNNLIVTNGNQTDTIWDGLKEGKTTITVADTVSKQSVVLTVVVGCDHVFSDAYIVDQAATCTAASSVVTNSGAYS